MKVTSIMTLLQQGWRKYRLSRLASLALCLSTPIHAVDISIASYTLNDNNTTVDLYEDASGNELNDDIEIVNSWSNPGSNAEIANMVGWQLVDPRIDLQFSRTENIQSLEIWLSDSDGSAGVAMPLQVTLSDPNSSFTQTFAVTNPAGDGSTIPVTFSGFSINTDSLRVDIARDTNNSWTFVSEINAFGSIAVAPSPTLSGTTLELLPNAPSSGGGQITNGSTITAEVSIGGGIGGPIFNTSPGGLQLKPNYLGQLYEVTNIVVSASPTSVNEGETRQLGALAILDDLTTLPLMPSRLAWSVISGPLTGISSDGVATANVVYGNTPATAQGTFAGVAGEFTLTVLNINDDDLDSYAGDGIDDSWQVTNFGMPPNANAAPNMNPDSDPYSNYLEFLTGFDPNNGEDFFHFGVVELTGSQATLELSKIIPGTRYSVWRSSDLDQSDPWTSITNFTTGVEVLNHPLIDMNATGNSEFYRIGVEPE